MQRAELGEAEPPAAHLDRANDCLGCMLSSAYTKFQQFDVACQANIAWSFATLSHNPGEELLEAIAVEAEKKLAEFSPQNISNLLYAFAKLEHKPNAFLEQASQAAVPILTNFTPQVCLEDILPGVICSPGLCASNVAALTS